MTKRTPNILYAGFREDFVTGELVSDAGDNVGGKPDLYNVFVLRLHTGTGVGGTSPNATTWFNRPQRDVAVATFTLDHRRIVETTANEKRPQWPGDQFISLLASLSPIWCGERL